MVVVEVVVDEVLVVEVEVEVEVDDVLVDDEVVLDEVVEVAPGGSGGFSNEHRSSPLVATVMYLRQIVAGNDPPVTEMPCTERMKVPSG